MSALTFETAEAQSQMLAAGQISALELMRATLDQIKATNSVNAIVSLRDEAALLAEAKAADQSERKGWLHGIPLAVKDLANARGLPTSMGSPLFAGQIAEQDDIMIARLRAAGALVIAKTNTPEFGLGSHTFNPVFGATLNPYDPARTCGGSSGGAAVALACGMVAIADGSDAMGSLRNPAAWNNVYGMRPTEGLLPDEPSPGSDLYLQRLSTVGPMARCPRDLAALLDTCAGPDPRQPDGLSLPLSLPEIEADVTGRKLGWLGDWGGAYAYEPGIAELCEAALGILGEIGLEIGQAAPPHPSEAIWEAWTGLRSFEKACGLAALYEDPEKRAAIKGTMQWEIDRGLALSAMDLHRLSVLRSEWYRAATRLFATYDLVALPAAQVWPFPVDVEYPKEIAGRSMDTYHRWMEVMVPASLIGLPVVCIPIGFGADGLPMGLQLIGPRGSDGRLLQIAEAWHKATDWPTKARPKQA